MNFQKEKYQIIVHLHPGIKDIKQDFKKIFKNLDFKTEYFFKFKKIFSYLKLFLNGN